MLNLIIRQLELPTPADGDLLYVVLHGLVSIVASQEKFHLYLVDIGSHHRYIAGTWLAETEIPKGTRGVLDGVKNGGAGLDTKANPVLKIPALPPIDKPGVYGVIEVPKPRKLYSLDRGSIKITGGAKNKLVTPPDTLAGVRVLEYEIETKFEDVKLTSENFAWTAGTNFTEFPLSGRIAALHIFDMPGGGVPANHHVEEFAVSSRMLGAEIQIDEAVQAFVSPPADYPSGLSKLELGDLDTRESDIADLILDFIRTGTWEPRGTVGGSCRACCGGADAVLDL